MFWRKRRYCLSNDLIPVSRAWLQEHCPHSWTTVVTEVPYFLESCDTCGLASVEKGELNDSECSLG